MNSAYIKEQWRRNEIESGGAHMSGANHRENFACRAPPLVRLAVQVQLGLFVLLNAFAMVSTIWVVYRFLFCSPCPQCPEQLTNTVHTTRFVALSLSLCFFRLHDLSLSWCMFCFTLDS